MRLFFELIQVGIGNRDKLSSVPSSVEWEGLYALAKKQAILGVCFSGIQHLYKTQPLQVTNLPLKLKMLWLGIAANIQKQNKLLNERAKEVTEMFLKGGFNTCVLKGQGIAALYQDRRQDSSLTTLRQSGDIDLWVEGKRGDVIAFMKQNGWRLGPVVVHHTDVEIFEDVSTEIHHYPSFAYSPIRWLKYKKWFREQAKVQFFQKDNSDGFLCPTVEFNFVYLLLHIYRHIFHEGVGLRQLMDYYMALHMTYGNADFSENAKTRAMKTLNWFGLQRFVGAVMYVEQHVFGLKDDMLLCPCDEKVGRFLLDEIMRAGNFGKYDQRVVEAHIGGEMHLFIHNILRLFRMVRYYPSEVLWAPFWKVAHWIWRKTKWNNL